MALLLLSFRRLCLKKTSPLPASLLRCHGAAGLPHAVHQIVGHTRGERISAYIVKRYDYGRSCRHLGSSNFGWATWDGGVGASGSFPALTALLTLLWTTRLRLLAAS